MALFPNNTSYRSGIGRPVLFPPAVRTLLILNVVIFLAGMIPLSNPVVVRGVGGVSSVDEWMQIVGALFPIGSSLYGPWQYLTMMFLHGSMGHILFNMLALWMFGNELEQLWGSRRFLLYYLICGIGAGIIHNLVTLATTDGQIIPAVGASGAIMGLLMAYGLLFPDRMIFVGLFFPMRARIAVFVIAGIDLLLGISAVGDGIAHFAHLGGAAMGLLLIQFFGNRFGRPAASSPERAAWRPDIAPRPAPPLHTTRSVEATWRDVSPSRATVPSYDFGADQARIDEVLDKINRTGYQNLSDEEKALLLEASRRMGK